MFEEVEPYHEAHDEHEDSYVPQYHPQQLHSEEDEREELPVRKYSSPPASIYEDTTEDGRIRVSEDGAPLDSFSVSDPIKGAHVTYTVRGYDEDGPFEGAKRYNDFFNLRAALLTRWPGVYVPPIPPKKAIGNKDDKFVEERKHFLERFLLLISKIDHIIKSDEFRLFSRPSGEIDKAVQMLPSITPDFLLDRYKTHLQLSEVISPADLKEYHALINEYGSFCKTFMKTLKHMRDSLKPYVPAADRQNENYKEMVNMLCRFEQNVFLEYVDNDLGKQVMTEYQENSNQLPHRLTNPLREFFYWVKGEIYDLQALNDCILGRDRLLKRKQKLESKRKSDQATLDKLTQGKTTLKTLFKGESGKQVTMTNLSNSIATAERDIEVYDKVLGMIEEHIATNVIPTFKENKEKFYYKV